MTNQKGGCWQTQREGEEPVPAKLHRKSFPFFSKRMFGSTVSALSWLQCLSVNAASARERAHHEDLHGLEIIGDHTSGCARRRHSIDHVLLLAKSLTRRTCRAAFWGCASSRCMNIDFHVRPSACTFARPTPCCRRLKAEAFFTGRAPVVSSVSAWLAGVLKRGTLVDVDERGGIPEDYLEDLGHFGPGRD